MPRLDEPPVLLRAFEPADSVLVVTAASDPLIPLISSVPPAPDPDLARTFIDSQHARLTDGDGYSFAIADSTSGEAVGQIGLWLAGMRGGRASVGYWVIGAHRGRGLAGHALTALSRWGLARPGIHRLELYVEPWNVASWRAAERAGYEREGLLRSWQQVGDQRRDMFMYSLLPQAAADRLRHPIIPRQGRRHGVRG